MIEQGLPVQQDFEYQYSYGGRAERQNQKQLDRHRNQDFERVEANAGGHIKFQIRMMYLMQTPKARNCMK